MVKPITFNVDCNFLNSFWCAKLVTQHREWVSVCILPTMDLDNCNDRRASLHRILFFLNNLPLIVGVCLIVKYLINTYIYEIF